MKCLACRLPKMTKKGIAHFYYNPFFLLAISFVIVAFGQKAWSPFLTFFASFIGYALFFKGATDVKFQKKVFYLFFAWYFFVQLFQLSWLTSTKYQGNFILIAYVGMAIFLALQFALSSFFIKKKSSFLSLMAGSAILVILEWSRLFFMCGFSFNPIGLTLSWHHIPMQLAAIGGVYFLSFWVLLTNLLGFKALEKSKRYALFWGIAAIFPYFFGFLHETWHEKKIEQSESLSVILVQTALLPEQKAPMENYFKDFISPIVQWERIFQMIQNEAKSKVDLIVLPESALPGGAEVCFYPYELAKRICEEYFDRASLPIEEPFVQERNNAFFASNSFFAKALANFYQAEVVIGLDYAKKQKNEYFNSAFYFSPNELTQRYDKRVLVPVAEYFPLEWIKNLAKEKYGISAAFTNGKEPKVFSKKNSLAVSVCYEETYGYLIRQGRLKGGELLVNVTNDAWFHNSKLYKQQFNHAILRAVENGAPLVRSCNTAVTSAVDCLGRTIKSIDNENEARGLHALVPKYNFATLYLVWGDFFVLGLSFFFLALYIILRSFSKKKKF
ncbi:MAG: apolipoprotein N-acyltransferase [Chlamydiae bacterium]|nr:apolipoprotein N-acyltransferase [Chlamydiota bacterium]